MSNKFNGVPDGELWNLAAAHDGTAFGELFERHSTAVYNHCFRRTGSWSTAEDLTSVVFLEAWRRRKEVRLSGESILPWLLAVANNTIRNSDRSIRRHRRLLAKLTGFSSTRFENDADQRMDDERAMSMILAKLSALRIDELEILALCDWSNLSYAEASAALDIPIGTVRSRLSRAREHLQSLIEEDNVSTPTIEVATTNSTKETDELA